MNVVTAIVIILILSALTFLQNMKREKRKSKSKPGCSELDYLHAYKNILQKVIQIENDLQNIEIPTDAHAHRSHAYFNPVEMLYIKNEITGNIKKLLDDYQHGLITISEAHDQLDELSKRLHVLFFSMAA